MQSSSAAVLLSRNVNRIVHNLGQFMNLSNELSNSIVSTNYDSGQANIVDPSDAQAIQKARGHLLSALSLSPEDLRGPKAKQNVISHWSKMFLSVAKQLCQQLPALFDLLLRVDSLDNDAAKLLETEAASAQKIPVTYAGLPSLAEIETEENLAVGYCQSRFKLFSSAVPSKQAQADYYLTKAKQERFSGAASLKALSKALQALSADELNEFLERKIYYEAARIEHLFRKNRLAKIYSNEELDQELRFRCGRILLPHKDIHDRRVLAAAAGDNVWTFEALKEAITNLQLLRSLKSQISNKQIKIDPALEFISQRRLHYCHRLFGYDEGPAFIELQKISIDQLRDLLRLDEIYKLFSK